MQEGRSLTRATTADQAMGPPARRPSPGASSKAALKRPERTPKTRRTQAHNRASPSCRATAVGPGGGPATNARAKLHTKAPLKRQNENPTLHGPQYHPVARRQDGGHRVGNNGPPLATRQRARNNTTNNNSTKPQPRPTTTKGRTENLRTSRRTLLQKAEKQPARTSAQRRTWAPPWSH